MKPVLKYLGGKSREIKFFEKHIPSFEHYIEPMCGGASVFWYLEPKNAIINDIDPMLINFYNVLQESYTNLMAHLDRMKNTEDCYYLSRRKLNSYLNGSVHLTRVELASLYYYLNKTAYGSHWRYNQKGELNMPYGHYENDNFKFIDIKYSNYLKDNTISILNHSVEDIFEFEHPNNTFMFLDPPYLESGEMYFNDSNLETQYKSIFNYMDVTNIRVMLVVKETDFVNDLFKDMIKDSYDKKYRIRSITEKTHKHLVICNY